MIRRRDATTMNLWSRGQIKVQIVAPGQELPIAFCDGTPEDEAELARIAEEEGAEVPEIHRKILKSGKEIWTLPARPENDFDE